MITTKKELKEWQNAEKYLKGGGVETGYYI